MAFARPYPRPCSTLRGLRATKLRQKELRRLARDGEIDPPMTAQLSRRLDDEIKMERDEKIETARTRRSDRKCRVTEIRTWLDATDWSDIVEELDADESEIRTAIVDARVLLFHEIALESRHVKSLIRATQLAGSATAAGIDDDTDWGDDAKTVTRHTVTQDAESAYA